MDRPSISQAKDFVADYLPAWIGSDPSSLFLLTASAMSGKISSIFS